jgi:flagellar protein FlaG
VRQVDIEAALEELVARAAASGASLDFRVDEDSGRVVVSVVDRRDGTVLRQMPSEEALRIARNLARFEPHLIEVSA